MGPWSLFNGIDDAARDFARTCWRLSERDKKEYGACIYAIGFRISFWVTKYKYFYPYYMRGGETNAVMAFISGYALGLAVGAWPGAKGPAKLVAFAHTHPTGIAPEFTWQDKALTWLPYIQYVYVTTYKKVLNRIGKFGLGFKSLGKF